MDAVKVTVVRGGGIAGMVMTTTVDGADLDAAAGTELAGLVDGCSFTDGAPSTVADGQSFEVTVTRDDGSTSRARYGQGQAPPGAGELVSWVLACPHAHQSVGR